MVGHRRKRCNLDDLFDSIYEDPTVLANYREDHRRASMAMRSSTGMTFLQKAILDRNPDKLAQLLAIGCQDSTHTLSAQQRTSAAQHCASAGPVSNLCWELDSLEDKSGVTLLHMAIISCQPHAVKILLDNGADYEKHTKQLPYTMESEEEYCDSISPLLLAVRCVLDSSPDDRNLSQKMEVVSLLLEAGCDVNRRVMEASAVGIAVNKGNIPLLQLLLKYGGVPNTSNDDLFQPLLIGIMNNNPVVCRILLEKGADVNRFVALKSRRGSSTFVSLLVVAINLEYFSLARLLLEHGADLDMVPRIYNSPKCAASVCRAVSQANLAILKLLLKYNPKLNWEMGSHGEHLHHTSPLQECIRQEFLAGAKLLVHAGCLIDHSLLHPNNNSGNSKVVAWLKEEAQQPTRLLMLCIYKLRQTLGNGINSKVTQLPLPILYHNQVLLSSLVDFCDPIENT